MNSGIHQILNTENGKIYIGSAVLISKRWAAHRSDLKAGRHINPHLQRAYNKCGVEAFEYFVVEYCEPVKETLLEKEQFWMDNLKVVEKGYNMCPTAGNCLGTKRSEESRKKASERMKGKRVSPSTEFKKGLVPWNKGKSYSPERCEQMSLARKGMDLGGFVNINCEQCGEGFKIPRHRLNNKRPKYCSQSCYGESRVGIPTWNKGLSPSEETRKKISETLKGTKLSEEHARNAAEGHKKYITFNNETLCIGDWAKKIGINGGTLSKRLRKWSVEKALTTPNLQSGRKKNER